MSSMSGAATSTASTPSIESVVSSLSTLSLTPSTPTTPAPTSADQIDEKKVSANTEKWPVAAGESVTMGAIAAGITSGTLKNIIVMTGAGISVSAGIPDFRTPGTGLYDNLQKYNLPEPMAIFELDFFRQHPKAFCTLAKELYPGEYAPTPTHHFIKLLNDRGVLLRNFTQNIDGLEYLAGIPADKIVQAHGGFQAAHCIDCKKEFTSSWVKEQIMSDQIPRCVTNTSGPNGCGGLVKPDIVFFGEGLPERFHELAVDDFPECDCLIVMGTSLMVQPFAGLIDRVRKHVPRVLINNEIAGVSAGLENDPQYRAFMKAINDPEGDPTMRPILMHLVQMKAQMAGRERGFVFAPSDATKSANPSAAAGGGAAEKKAYRDVFMKTTCDAGVAELASLMNATTAFKTLIAAGMKPLPRVPAAATTADTTAAAVAAAATDATPAAASSL